MLAKNNFLWPIVASLLMSTVSAEDTDEVTTITETNYITPAWFMEAIETALVNNPPSLNNGIKIVFVDGDDAGVASPAVTSTVTSPNDIAVGTSNGTPDGTPASSNNDEYETIVTSSNMAYLVNSDGTSYTTSAPVAYTTVVPKNAKQNSERQRSTIYETETVTEDSSVYVQITETAQTTTKVIFSATTTPKTIYEGTTTYEPISTTISNPVAPASVVSKTRTNTISLDTDSLSEGVTFSRESSSLSKSASGSAAFPTSGYSSGSSGFSSILAGGTTIESTIESTISSSSSRSAASDVYSSPNVGKLYNDSTSTIDLRVSSYSSGSSLSSAVYSNSSIPSSSVMSLDASSTGMSSSEISTSDGSSLVTASSSELLSSSAILSSSVIASSASSITASSSSYESSTSSSSDSYSSSSSSVKVPSDDDSVGGGDLFKVISTDSPSSVFTREELPLSIPDGVSNDIPYQTNKFYVNLFLDDQTDLNFVYPYSVWFKNQDYYGFGVQHYNASKRVFGPKNDNNDGDSYFYNPVGNADLIISATSLEKGSNYLSVTDMKEMSAKVSLSSTSSVGSDYIELPIVQGMGFVSAVYHGDMKLELNTLIGISTIKQETSSALNDNTLKYRVTLFDDVEYLVYATLPEADDDFEISADDSFHVVANKAVDGLILQVALAPEDSTNDKYYNQASGMYPVSASVSGTSSGTSAEYSFTYKTKGSSTSGNTMIFALPHHVQSFSSETSGRQTPIKVLSTTKGNMVGLLANEMKLVETLEANVQFLPWAPIMSKDLSYTSDQLKLLAQSAQDELNVDIKATVANMNSNYYSGKVIDKYANILLVVNDIIGDEDYSKEILEDLKSAFETFTNNEQYYPLMYDTKFKGVTSSAAQDGDTGADFGGSYYNDHHFHYGYFVHAAAVVGYVDKQYGGSWAEDNKQWVNDLIRDVANPSEDDSYFPVSRMFDWFHGHSWASGLFAAGDGRNEESSSEDYHFSYGMKLWGKVIGDESMEGRGSLMLAVSNRAMNNYFLFSDDNEIIPEEMLPNKVSGIFFDNKIAYTTYFGDANSYPQYVHGIHMIPMTPAAALVRGTDYVQQEWDSAIVNWLDSVTGGWLGLIRLNQALIDPETSYDFFSADDFSSGDLDNGQSRTWSLAFSGGILNGL